MKKRIVTVQSSQNWFAVPAVKLKLRVAQGFFSRFFGLLTSRQLRQDEGILLTNTRMIHTCFMRMPIDILFIDKKGFVISRRTDVGAFQMAWDRHAEHVLELKAGALEHWLIVVGDRVLLEKKSPRKAKPTRAKAKRSIKTAKRSVGAAHLDTSADYGSEASLSTSHQNMSHKNMG